MSEQSASVPVWVQMLLRISVGLTAAGLYEFDRHVLGLDEGVSIVIVVIAYLWWRDDP